MARVEITAGTIHVDGHDLSRAVRGVTVQLGVDHPYPKVELDLQVQDVTRLGVEHAEVLIPDETRDALVKLGWTPPRRVTIRNNLACGCVVDGDMRPISRCGQHPHGPPPLTPRRHPTR